MRKRKIGICALAMSILMALALFAGCAPATQPEASGEASPAATESAAAEESAAAQATEPAESAAADGEEMRTIVDHTGEEVQVPTEIDRIVVTSFYPFPSVISMFLGSAEKLVGIHPVSMSAAENGILSKIFPEILEADTSFMQGDELNIEALVALEPDVVFYTAKTTELKEQIEQAGLPAVGISASAWDYDVLETYDNWVDVLSQMFPEQEDKADMVSSYSQEIYDMIQERVKDIPDEERTRALFLFQYDESAMITSGKNFFGQYWATAGGGVNVAEELQEASSNATINMEQVYEWDPDIIYITNFTTAQPEDLYNNAIGGDDWSNVTAVKNQNVHKMPLGSYRTYTPGTDTPLTLLWMAKTMYPDLFADIDMTQEVKDYYQEIYGVELTDEDVASMYTPSSAAAEGFTAS